VLEEERQKNKEVVMETLAAILGVIVGMPVRWIVNKIFKGLFWFGRSPLDSAVTSVTTPSFVWRLKSFIGYMGSIFFCWIMFKGLFGV